MEHLALDSNHLGETTLHKSGQGWFVTQARGLPKGRVPLQITITRVHQRRSASAYRSGGIGCTRISQQMVMSTLFDYSFGVTSVSSQTEVEPGPLPRRGPPDATDDSGPTCGARGKQGTTTGQNNKESLRIAHWNANGLKDKKLALQNFLKTNSIDVCCIQET